MDKRGIVAVAGLALAIVSGIHGGSLPAAWQIVAVPGSSKAAAGQFATLGGELLLVGGLWLVAGINDDAADVSLALVLGLWLAWVLHNSADVIGFVQKIGVAKQ